MQKLDATHMEYAISILHNSNLDKLKILYLHGGSQMGLVEAGDFLPNILKVVRKQIFLDSFKLREEDLQMIFENSIKTINLCLVNCQIAQVGSDFFIDEDQEYCMENLDLFWTCIKVKEEYLNEGKFKELLKTLRDTKLKESLERLHVCEEDYPKNELEELLYKENFNVELRVDNIMPHPYD